MKNVFFLSLLTALTLTTAFAQGGNEDARFKNSSDLDIDRVEARYDSDLELLIFSVFVKGEAGKTQPEPVGQMAGAPILGYVFPTTLTSTDVGFSKTEGIVALALTSHPDFDDTPLWDENMDRDYANDGRAWHAHWVVLRPDERVPGGLSVRQFEKEDPAVTLPPTNPGMPMFMDSPGFQVVTKGNRISVVVPAYRMNGQTDFQFDGVTAYMEVNPTNPKFPLLGVYAVYSVASGDLSLPYTVSR